MKCPVCKTEVFSLMRIKPLLKPSFYVCLNCHAESSTLDCFKLTPKEKAIHLPTIGTEVLRGRK